MHFDGIFPFEFGMKNILIVGVDQFKSCFQSPVRFCKYCMWLALHCVTFILMFIVPANHLICAQLLFLMHVFDECLLDIS